MIHPATLIARQELVLATRSRWTQIFAVVFAVLALAVAASGYIISGGRGVQDFARTSASLLQLVILIVPLASLVIGVLSIGAERGYAEVLFSQPISRAVILIGQVIGVTAALIGAEAIGFGAAGVVIFSYAGSEGIESYYLLVASALALTAIFAGLASFIGAGAIGRKRTRALATALVVWFAMVILFDVAVLGVASFLPSGRASRLIIVSVLLNPIDAIRTGALLATEGTAAFGSASLAFFRFTHGSGGATAALLVSVAFWIAAPLVAGMLRLRRTEF